MASQTVDVIATLTPRAGKVDRVLELLSDLSNWIRDNELGTLKYHLHREVNKTTGVEELIVLESYENTAAMKAHAMSTEFKALGAIVKAENLLEKATQVKIVKPVAGFSSRI